MLSLPKISAAAGLVAALSLTALSAAPAEASYFTQRCNDNGCYRVRCHDDGYGCVRVSSYRSSGYQAQRYFDPNDAYYPRTAHYRCSADGESCHWTDSYRDDDNRY